MNKSMILLITIFSLWILIIVVNNAENQNNKKDSTAYGGKDYFDTNSTILNGGMRTSTSTATKTTVTRLIQTPTIGKITYV